MHHTDEQGRWIDLKSGGHVITLHAAWNPYVA